MHWADGFAKQVVEKKGKKEYIVESGITPSGVVHIGNAREILTQYFVYQGILKLGTNKAKFIYIWDDFDRFRKVPKGVPGEFEKYIGMPLSKVPDPFGCHKSYAEHFESELVEEMRTLNIEPVYMNATELYKKGTFTENIKTALEKTDKVKEILNKFRKEPLADDWLPISLYCEKCGKDSTIINYLGGYKLSYKCSCGFENEIDFREVTDAVNMKWRIDWPSRWAYFGVDFESSGKDHKSRGGSWDTAVMLSKEIFGYEPPVGPMYEFIHLKGQKEKMSSSKGNIATVSQLLNIYEPELVRFIYAQRLNKTIFVPFDLDIYNIYNEFDKCERIYFGVEEGTRRSDGASFCFFPSEKRDPFSQSEKKVLENKKERDNDLKRRYELSRMEKYEKCPQRISFSELVLLVQVVPEDNLRKYISKLMMERNIEMSEMDLKLSVERVEKAKYWIENYAPADVKIKLVENKIEVTDNQREGLKEISSLLKNKCSTEELQKQIFEVAKKRGSGIFQTAYLVLIGKKQGPKLAMLIDAIGRKKVLERFEELK